MLQFTEALHQGVQGVAGGEGQAAGDKLVAEPVKGFGHLPAYLGQHVQLRVHDDDPSKPINTVCVIEAVFGLAPSLVSGLITECEVGAHIGLEPVPGLAPFRQ